MREMLSYLAAALPPDASAAARLLALQCALRMNATLHVRLSKGVLRSLRLDHPEPLGELARARWLRPFPPKAANEIAAELLDATLLGQAPARPDRLHAAHWALGASRSSSAGLLGPQQQLVTLHLAAHTVPGAGGGLCELEQMARACGTPPAELPGILAQLAVTGLVTSWRACPDSGDLLWSLRPPGTVPLSPDPGPTQARAVMPASPSLGTGAGPSGWKADTNGVSFH
ncbi:hypothetical protein ACIO13_23835 [Streptomyces sp. NPDC087425]|uniref:hypothetical protein n=1 Tax=Streptomyces sp. NPDC087425 TaxID=3365787 RepID=UPI00381E3441